VAVYARHPLPRLHQPMPTNLDISAVVPVHNESGFIEDALPQLVAAMETLGIAFEVIIAENGSLDTTADIAKAFAAHDPRVRVLESPNPDYGAAMRDGFTASRATWIVNFDIDYFSADFLRNGLKIETDADIILGSKRADGSDDRRSRLRRMGTWGFNLVLRVLFRSRVSDTHGMKMVRQTVFAAVGPNVVSTKDLFDTELVIRAEREGYRIVEIPVTVEELRAARTSFVRRIPRTVGGLLKVRRALSRESKSRG
jgi:glycosyltransferase involved in cell wall biosynthesis